MKVRHRKENSPSTYRGQGVRTDPGAVVEVDEETAESLLQKPYFEAVEDGDDDSELCGTEQSDGSTCERPADDCPYH